MSFGYFFRNKYLMTILVSGFLINLVVWVIFWRIFDLDRMALILHYNSFFGIDKVVINSEEGKFLKIFFAPLSSLGVMLINDILGFFLIYSNGKKSKEKGDLNSLSTARLGGYFLLMSGAILQIIILIYAIAILLINH